MSRWYNFTRLECSTSTLKKNAAPSLRKLALRGLGAQYTMRSLFYSLTHRPVTARHFIELLLDAQHFFLGAHRRVSAPSSAKSQNRL